MEQQNNSFGSTLGASSDTPQATETTPQQSYGSTLSSTQNNNFGSSLNDASSIPIDVRDASELQGTQDFNGFCQSFVDTVTGMPHQYGSASEAAQAYSSQGKLNPDWQNAPVGSILYFYDPNQPNGHTGIVSDNQGDFISATYQGVRQDNLQQWMQSTGQQPLGFVNPNSQ